MRLVHNRRPIVEAGYVPHCVESIIPLFDEVLHYLWAETEGRKLLNDLPNQFLELRRAGQSSKGINKERGLAWR